MAEMNKAMKPKTRSKTVSKAEKELLKHDPYCPTCVAWFAADATGAIRLKYCRDCGTELVQPAYCVSCGSVIPSLSTYCPGCGFIAIR